MKRMFRKDILCYVLVSLFLLTLLITPSQAPPPTYGIKLVNAYPDHYNWVESQDPYNTLYAKVLNKGTVSTPIYVEFKITDESGLMQITVITDAVLIDPKKMVVFILTIDRFWLIARGASPPGYGKYYVKVCASYYDGVQWILDGCKTFKRPVTLLP